MKTFKRLSIILAAGIGMMCTTSCKDYLDVYDALAAELTMEEVFNNTDQTIRFLRYIYSGIPDYSHIILGVGNAGLDGMSNPWSSMCDELRNGQGNTANTLVTGYHAGSIDQLQRWSLYKQIRQANLFLANAHEITPEGDRYSGIDAKRLAEMKNEARFLRAFYHYLLFEVYGAVPIMQEAIESSRTDLDFYRNSVDEVIEFIDSELRACLPGLPEKEATKERAAAPTKGAAYAILAKLHIYAASPLFNGGYPEAVALRDNQGKQLFPERNDAKWNRALSAIKEFIDYAEGRYELFKVEDKENGGIDVEESLYQLFQVSENNAEAVWQTSKSSWGNLNDMAGREIRCTPNRFSGFPNVGVLQEVIDDYFMANGKDIDAPGSGYVREGISKEAEDGEGVPNLCKNREPRFYRDITYAGMRWHDPNRTQIYFHRNTPDDITKDNHPFSGYVLYKGMNHEVMYRHATLPSFRYRATMVFRLADFYLLYAEVMNKVNPTANRDEILKYINFVRERAGIPNLEECNPAVLTDSEAMAEAIRRERRIELFAEGQRYFDVRRWMLAETPGYEQGGPIHGMDMNAANLEDFSKIVAFENRVFERRMYLLPLPLREIQNSTKLVQNPGW